MPRNGTGQYVLPPGINPVKPGTTIASAWANTTLQDIALALSSSLAADGQKAWTGDQNANGHTVTGLGAPEGPTDAVPYGFMMSSVGTAGNISGWARPEDHLLPEITQVASTTIFVPAGTGFIIDPVSGRLQVSWAGGNQVLSLTADAWITTIAVDISGEVVQLAGNIKPEWARSHIILGTVNHASGQIDSINNTPSVFGEVPYATYDLSMALRNTVVSGNQLSGNLTSGLSLDLSAGVIFMYGGSPNELNNPNYVDTPAESPLNFFPATGASSVEAITSVLPVGKYNPDGSGVVEDIPGGPEVATVFRLFRLGGSFIMMYGQHVYESLADAEAAIFTESVVYPSKLSIATFVAAIAVTKGATDLKDPSQAIIANPGGSGGGSGSGGSPLVIQTITGPTTVNGGDPNLLLVSTATTDIEVTLKNAANGSTFGEGDTVSVLQWGTGKVTIVIEDDAGELKPADLFLTSTRGEGCVITAACIFPDTDSWSLAGDLEPGPDIGGGGGGGGGGGDTAWTDAPVQTGWNLPASRIPQCRKDGSGVVHLQGRAVSSATPGPYLILLPTGYRPAQTGAFAAATQDPSNAFSAGVVLVNASGQVSVTTGGPPAEGTQVHFDGISFYAGP